MLSRWANGTFQKQQKLTKILLTQDVQPTSTATSLDVTIAAVVPTTTATNEMATAASILHLTT